MKTIRKIIEIDEERCDGCGKCVLACAEGAVAIVDGKARLVKDSYCDGLGACIGECPQGALRIVEREAAEFDPEAVEQHLGQTQKQGETLDAGPHLRCPSSRIQQFEPSGESGSPAIARESAVSALSNWPVKIRLVPASAPFLKGANLLVAADCTAAAFGNFHCGFLQGKTLLIGCPKCDDVSQLARKFVEIFRVAFIRSVTVLIMEVHCCSVLAEIVRKAMAQAGKDVPIEVVIIGVRGSILDRKKPAA